MSYVLDTNIVVAALNGDRDVVARLNQVPEGEALLPAMVLGELRYGALSSSRVAENLERIERILDVLVLITMDRGVVERFASIKAHQRRIGFTKSDADLLIAATAMEQSAILVTNDQALHDGTIGGLQVENWIVT